MNLIYFGTNRKPNRKDHPTDFGRAFSADGLSNLRFGRARVDGGGFKIEVARERLVPTEDGKSMDSKRCVLGSLDVFKNLRDEMRKNRHDAVVFIHGYNVDFGEALETAARLHENFAELNGGRGVSVAVFTWPSDGSMMPWLAYANDRRDAAASGPAFARGLMKLSEFLHAMRRDDACDRKIHLIAHSMGNYVLRHALQEMIHHCGGRLPRIFDQIFLMAADEDDDAFEKEYKLMRLPRLGRRVNVYFNRGDRAMAISDMTKGNPDRLGDDGPRAPFQVPAKVTQVDCSAVVSGLVEHSYFIDEPAVVRDMARVMEGIEPNDVTGRRFLPDRNHFVLTGDG